MEHKDKKDLKDLFAVAAWNDDDLISDLETRGFYVNNETLNTVKKYIDIEEMESAMMESGWKFVDQAINEAQEEQEALAYADSYLFLPENQTVLKELEDMSYGLKDVETIMEKLGIPISQESVETVLGQIDLESLAESVGMIYQTYIKNAVNVAVKKGLIDKK